MDHYESPEDLREIKLMAKLKEPTFTRDGELYFDPKLDEWYPIEHSTIKTCEHEDTVCPTCINTWMEDYYFKLVHVPTGTEAGLNDVPGIPRFQSYGG